jgi:hypothetical protein
MLPNWEKEDFDVVQLIDGHAILPTTAVIIREDIDIPKTTQEQTFTK